MPGTLKAPLQGLDQPGVLVTDHQPEARHGHQSRARTFDGDKSYFSVDPGEELITNVAVTAANTADREVIDKQLAEPDTCAPTADTKTADGEPAGNIGDDNGSGEQGELESKDFEVYGDSAYANGATLDERRREATTCAPKCRRCAMPTGFPKTSSGLI